MKKKAVMFGFIFVISLTSLFIDVRSVFGGHLTASGCSISKEGYLSDIAKEYENQTGEQMLILGGGSVVGLHDLLGGKVDIAASCRGRTADDPERIDYIQVAWDALVFIVHKNNPVDTITLGEARNIFAGKITEWKELKGNDGLIIKILPSPGKGLSGVGTTLRKSVLDGKAPDKTLNAISYTSAGLVEQAIETNIMGFGVTGFSSARKRNVKMLKFNGVMPTKKNIASNRYPLKRPLYLVISKNPRPEVKRFIDFVLSNKGQKLISSYGMVSLRDMR